MTKGKFRKETSAAQQKRRTILQTYLTSLVSLVLCVTMFFGTTAAWFTDTVETNQNQMYVGTLKVELKHGSYKNGQLGEMAVVDKDHKVFDSKNTWWEPGYTAVEKFELTENGTLAFGYNMTMAYNFSDTAETKAKEEAFTKAVDVWTYTGENAATYVLPANYEDMIAEGWTKVGSLHDVLTGTLSLFSGEMDAAKVNETNAATATHLIALHLADTYGDNENDVDIQGLKMEDITIKLVATQMSSENDAFGSDYDAAPGADKWDGEEAKPEDAPADEDNDGVIAINTADELAGFAAAVNAGTSYSGKTIVLASDIDLGNKAWTPIGAADSKAYFQGTFDGQGHTIYGLNVDKSTDDYKYSTAGFFGWIDAAAATIKNVKFANATVKGSHWVGVVAGYMTGEISNCSVTNSTVIGFNVNDDANGDKVGGIVGYVNSGSGKLDGNTVSDSAITGYRDVAGLAGAVATTNAVKNNTVKNVTVTYEADHGAEIVTKKTEVVVDETNKAINVTLVQGKFVTVSNDDELQKAIKDAATDCQTTITLQSGTYAGDIELTASALGKRGDLVFKAAPDATPVIAGTVTLGYRQQGVDAAMFNSNVTFEGITFDHELDNAFSIEIGDVKSINLINCKVISKGEYGIHAANGNATGPSKISDCTFENAAIQGYGNFCSDLIIEKSTFNNARINIQGGNRVTVQGCTFNNTLTTANVGDSFYAIRSNSTPITVKDCKINIDSELTEVATAQAKWYLLANRGTTNWTVENVAITLTDAAKLQTELKVTACTSSGVINCTNVTVNGEVYSG